MSRPHRKKGSAFRWVVVVLLALTFAAAFFYRDDLRDLTVDDTRYAAEIAAAADRYGLDPQLVRAVVFQESRFDPAARGGAGEVGLMQVLPSGAGAEWARWSGSPPPDAGDLKDPEFNLNVGCWYLAEGMLRYEDYREATELALARYNAGQSRADKWRPGETDGSVAELISISGTRRYVSHIMKRYRNYMAEAERKKFEGLEGSLAAKE